LVGSDARWSVAHSAWERSGGGSTMDGEQGKFG
jgi:hypothetical protein